MKIDFLIYLNDNDAVKVNVSSSNIVTHSLLTRKEPEVRELMSEFNQKLKVLLRKED